MTDIEQLMKRLSGKQSFKFIRKMGGKYVTIVEHKINLDRLRQYVDEKGVDFVEEELSRETKKLLRMVI